MRTSIFAKQSNLKPSAMRTVAERRYGDANALRNTGANERANGVAYLAGFVVEILLKALLVEGCPSIARTSQHAPIGRENKKSFLVWRSHDLEEILASMPELEAALTKKGEIAGHAYFSDLKVIYATWNIQARYSSHSMTMKDAPVMLDKVGTLKELLK